MYTEKINHDATKEDISFDARPSTVFYEQWYQIIKSLPSREREKAFKYIFEYAFYGIEPEKDKTTSMSYVVFGMAKPNIDSAQKRYDAATENGQKGGRPKKVTEEVVEKILELRKKGMTQREVASELCLSLKTIQRVEKDKSQNHNYNVNDNVNDNDNSVASFEVNTEVAIAPETSDEVYQTETEVNFKSKLNSLSNNRIKVAIDKKIKETIIDGYSHQKIIDSIIKEFTGTFYQCDEEVITEYVNNKLLQNRR